MKSRINSSVFHLPSSVAISVFGEFFEDGEEGLGAGLALVVGLGAGEELVDEGKGGEGGFGLGGGL